MRKALALREAIFRRDAETAPGAAGALRAGAVSGAAHGRTEDEPLYLSEGTVKQYINRIYSKLQLTGSAQEKRRALIAFFENY